MGDDVEIAAASEPPRSPPTPPACPHMGDIEMAAASEPPSDMLRVNVHKLKNETKCPICMDVMRNSYCVMECLHRFCGECIQTALRLNNNECPSCRTHVPSKRSLRPDNNFDALISLLYGEEEEVGYTIAQVRQFSQFNKERTELLAKQSKVVMAEKIQDDRERAKEQREQQKSQPKAKPGPKPVPKPLVTPGPKPGEKRKPGRPRKLDSPAPAPAPAPALAAPMPAPAPAPRKNIVPPADVVLMEISKAAKTNAKALEQRGVHITLLPDPEATSLGRQELPPLPAPYVACMPGMSMGQICKLVASRLAAAEVEGAEVRGADSLEVRAAPSSIAGGFFAGPGSFVPPAGMVGRGGALGSDVKLGEVIKWAWDGVSTFKLYYRVKAPLFG